MKWSELNKLRRHFHACHPNPKILKRCALPPKHQDPVLRHACAFQHGLVRLWILYFCITANARCHSRRSCNKKKSQKRYRWMLNNHPMSRSHWKSDEWRSHRLNPAGRLYRCCWWRWGDRPWRHSPPPGAEGLRSDTRESCRGRHSTTVSCLYLLGVRCSARSLRVLPAHLRL